MIHDPWTDAAKIATQLARPGTRLVVALGAEAWCAKCRAIRPAFDAWAAASPEQDLFLWLDLEEHAEFIGDYLPEDLPMLVEYRNGALHRLHPIPPEATTLVKGSEINQGLKAR